MKISILTIVICAFLFSCTKNKDTGVKELHLVSEAKVSGFDPAQAGDLYQSNEMGKVFEGLYEYHPTKRPYELIPNLAEGMPEISKDQLTYTFKIKKGVLFHDDKCFPNGKGRELKAKDFEYSIKRLADPKIMSRGWWLFETKLAGVDAWREKHAKSDKTDYDEVLEGVKAIDDYTLQLKLVKPYPQLMYALAMTFTVAVAKEAVETYGKEFLNHPVGTGPFILPIYQQSNTIVYTKNPTFREKYMPDSDNKERVPFVDKITVHIIEEVQPQWLNFNKAKVDVLLLPKENFGQALKEDKKTLKDELKEKGVNYISEPMMDVTFYAFNFDNPLYKNNLKLRQAISLAYDRKKNNELFFEGTGELAQGVIPPGLGGYDPNFKNPYATFDLEKAKQLLKEAGYPEGKGLPVIRVLSSNTARSRQITEFFVKCMTNLGVKVQMDLVSWPDLVNRVIKRQFEIYTMAWHGDYPDAENFLGLLYCPNKSPGSNGAGYCNPKVDELFRKATVMQDSPERSKLYAELNQMIALDVPWIFDSHRERQYLYQGWVKNFVYTEYYQHLYQYLDVDLEKKKELISKF